MQQLREWFFPPRINLLVGNHSLLRGVAFFHRLDKVIAIGCCRLELRVFPAHCLPDRFKGTPVDRGTVVERCFISEVIGHHRFAINLFTADRIKVIRVEFHLALVVHDRQLRVIPIPHRRSIRDHVGVQRILLFRKFPQWQTQFAAILQLVAVNRVVITLWVHLHAGAIAVAAPGGIRPTI